MGSTLVPTLVPLPLTGVSSGGLLCQQRCKPTSFVLFSVCEKVIGTRLLSISGPHSSDKQGHTAGGKARVRDTQTNRTVLFQHAELTGSPPDE